VRPIIRDFHLHRKTVEKNLQRTKIHEIPRLFPSGLASRCRFNTDPFTLLLLLFHFSLSFFCLLRCQSDTRGTFRADDFTADAFLNLECEVLRFAGEGVLLRRAGSLGAVTFDLELAFATAASPHVALAHVISDLPFCVVGTRCVTYAHLLSLISL
jgi:hypothetical protein